MEILVSKFKIGLPMGGLLVVSRQSEGQYVERVTLMAIIISFTREQGMTMFVALFNRYRVSLFLIGEFPSILNGKT